MLEAFPVESHLDLNLNDHILAEVVGKTIESTQDAMDYLTWTFYYRRLAQNPVYYGLKGNSHHHISDHLSDLLERTLGHLESSKCIALERRPAAHDLDIAPLNLAMIASYFYVKYTTMEVFQSSLTGRSRIKGLLEVLCYASEFDDLAVRPGEEEAIRKVLHHSPLAVSNTDVTQTRVKVHALLQAHFSRTALAGELLADQQRVVGEAVRLLAAVVDVLATNEWLNPCLAAMELSQMVVQGMWG